MADPATSPELRNAFRIHLSETEQQTTRLERCFFLLDEEAESEACEAMQGLIAEGQEIIDAEGDPEVQDSALIATAQPVEHYEMAGYGCA